MLRYHDIDCRIAVHRRSRPERLGEDRAASLVGFLSTHAADAQLCTGDQFDRLLFIGPTSDGIFAPDRRPR